MQNTFHVVKNNGEHISHTEFSSLSELPSELDLYQFWLRKQISMMDSG